MIGFVALLFVVDTGFATVVLEVVVVEGLAVTVATGVVVVGVGVGVGLG